jgi:hypothetical protein
MPISSRGATPAPIHRVALVATLSILAAAALVAWQPSMASSQPICSSDGLASSKESPHTPTIRLATNDAAVL